MEKLERLKNQYGGGAARSKLALLEQLQRRRLASGRQVFRLHEALCFLRAFPDNRALLARVEALLEAFAERFDLRRSRPSLTDTGIAGTALRYPFYWFTARWLARRCPHQLTIDWAEFEKKKKLKDLLHLLLPYPETLAL
ncbi:MAG: hypothetical protein ACE5HB_10580, partial [Terriglobia bacterium]